MRNECMGIVNLTKKGEPRISKINATRPISSTPIAGRYRVIDFVLSNMVNSGIKNVGIYAKEKYRSLTDHLGSGKDWDLSRKKGGLFIFSPENTKYYNINASRNGDIYNLLANIDFIERGDEEYVLIAPSYMICNIDYSEALEYHKKSNNDITMIYKNINNADEDFKGNLTLDLDGNNRIISIGNNVGAFPRANISMETYIMKREDLIKCIYRIVSKGSHLFLEDFIIEELNNIKVGAYEHKGYLKCIDSIQSYFEISNDLLNRDVAKELLYSDRKIFTKEKNESPTIYTDTANVKNSFIATGCVIEGSVENSIIFRKVKVKKGSVIKNSIIMQNCTIEPSVELHNVVFDKNIFISEGKELKGDESYPIVIEKNISM
ncbi:glucose-1-phosphate adenylyltransferase subunit GlgD [Romboutsia weinsteinii]|uniref:Glucose-1-phosphate adenylyltransferase subunit GlgD n=1 Tax=Romboutsia weinsteinii TaxID=2020949 RepID=A0A371J365_9FIRM|nr:glucose-1-phosphate adenylyltransferase subunit GlgD [Romboutsia weinsteinii]RDY27175.1 glucose-1-phosphate adenylyltransferase subunit GlgD [Romboutsia weinsteinii]